MIQKIIESLFISPDELRSVIFVSIRFGIDKEERIASVEPGAFLDQSFNVGEV